MSSQLKAACQDVNQSYTTLKPAQKTRWNSTARNGESVLKLKEALIHLYEQNREKDERWEEYELTNQEWRVLKGTTSCLQQVLIISKVFENEVEPTSNLVIPKLYELKRFLERFENDIENDR